jgi:hypothetical protein
MCGAAGVPELTGFLKNAFLLVVSVAASLLFAEGGSRYMMPIRYGYTVLSLQGGPLGAPLEVYGSAGELQPGVSYRVLTQEFDTVVTHTKEGYRGLSSPANPDIVFIGDSFTYGVGLNDQETIPYVYCHEMHLVCVNLGVPGTGTVLQVARLQSYLREYGWHPREVKLLFMGMTSALMSGNDLNDNLKEMTQRHSQDSAAVPAKQAGFWSAIYDHRSLILEHSNIARNAYYIYAPLLRAVFSPKMNDQELQRGLAITSQQFKILQDLAASYGFAYSIYILPPMQDLMNGGYQNTLAAIRKIAATDRVYTTAPALLDGGPPQQYYYAMDGHPSASGAAKLARFMVARDSAG